jgi:hypothetical protein
MKHARKHDALAALAGSILSIPALAQTIGSPLIDRPTIDSSSGVMLIYRGSTSPFPSSGTATTWSAYVKTSNGNLTPLLFEITATNQYTLRAVGTSRVASIGVQSWAFGTIAGNPGISAGKHTFGFITRAYTGNGTGTPVGGTSSTGVIPYTSSGAGTVDNWSYVINPAITIGAVFGQGGVALDAQGLAGRTYSAQMSEGCYANCDGSTASPILGAADFVCFLNRFRAGDSYANCDSSTTAPVLGAADFVCFLTKFRAGCP